MIKGGFTVNTLKSSLSFHISLTIIYTETGRANKDEETDMMADPYSILGVTRSASPDEIKSAYRRLARETHPDSKPGDKTAENRFKAVSNAYSLLLNPAKRHKFDAGEIDADGNRRSGSASHSAAHGCKRGTKKARPPRERSSIKARGADVTYVLKVSLLEATVGTQKAVRMTNGKTLKVRIPPKTEDGQTLRLKNQGMSGLGGGPSGDALVEILIETDGTFRADGLDVYSEESVSLPEAMLGAQIQVRTLHGTVRVTVPENSNSGTRLRLKGKGLRRENDTNKPAEKGDHYVTLTVSLPKNGNGALKRFVKKWALKNSYSVRDENLNSNAIE